LAGLIEARPHDLVRLSNSLEIVPDNAPLWVANALRAAPWVVVLRAANSQGRVADGVRGTSRSHRFAMEMCETAVIEVLTPEDLAMRTAELKRELPAIRTLRAVSALLAKAGVPWGPTGSVAFELASGVPVVTLGERLGSSHSTGRSAGTCLDDAPPRSASATSCPGGLPD
jgi:phosphoribosyl-dephospho-CoA transferase